MSLTHTNYFIYSLCSMCRNFCGKAGILEASPFRILGETHDDENVVVEVN